MEKPEKIIAIIAVVQICKFYGVPSKLLPIFALIVGAILEFSDNPTGNGVLDGILLGAIVTGSFGLVKGAGWTIVKSFKGWSPPEKRSSIGEKRSSIDDIDGLEPDDDRINY